MKHVDNMMAEAVEEGVFPGGVLLVKKDDSLLFYESYGLANIVTGEKMQKKTMFDLASLTKPLATALAVMDLIFKAELNLKTRLSEILPEMEDKAKGGIKIKHLLLHISGFPAYYPYYQTLEKIEGGRRTGVLRAFILEEPLIAGVGKELRYSDIGFMVLRWVIELISGKPLDAFVTQEIYQPLGIDDILFPGVIPLKSSSGVAATEFCGWRKRLLQGVVHDENAYVVGGVEGHAGLFGNARAICKLLSLLLSAYRGNSTPSFLDTRLIRVFLTPDLVFKRALGFDSPLEKNSSCGYCFSKSTIGHLGFTGVSFWVDIDHRIIVILLTNRIHPTRKNEKIKTFRPRIHNCVMKSIMQGRW